jgi:competence protein ComEC
VGAARRRLAVRHVAARLDVASVDRWRAGSGVTRAANGVRRLLLAGASSLRDDRRALLGGFLLGDDREVSAPVEADFRASGLTHLLAVSGQNLMFLLAIAGPALRRLELRGRLVASLAIIGFFAVLTRAEPSVLRASAMAVLACWAAFTGRPITRIRVLALAVAALVVVDPMLPHRVGFQLSVGASLGLALLAAPIAERIAGPRWLAESLAVTAAAQVGVAPILLTTFGGMPVVTPLANLLAVPVAGPLTAWGFAGGVLAGVLGTPFAAVLHVPTDVMVRWIAGVARVCARLPLGVVDARHLALAVAIAAPAIRFRRVVLPCAIAAAVVVLLPPAHAISGQEVARGAHLWRRGAAVLVVDGQVDAGRLLDGLRRAGVRRIDLVVARRGNKDVAALLAELRARVAVRAIAAPVGNRIRDATAVAAPIEVHVGRLVVRLEPGDGSLDARI